MEPERDRVRGPCQHETELRLLLVHPVSDRAQAADHAGLLCPGVLGEVGIAKPERRCEERSEQAFGRMILGVQARLQRAGVLELRRTSEEQVHVQPRIRLSHRVSISVSAAIRVRQASQSLMWAATLALVDERRVEAETAQRIVIVVSHSFAPERARSSSSARLRQVTSSWRTYAGEVARSAAMRSFGSSWS